MLYENMESFILDQYGEFLVVNTKEAMTEAEWSAFREKDGELLREMSEELDAYLAEERKQLQS